MRIYVDAVGIISDFVKGVCTIFDIDYAEYIRTYPLGTDYMLTPVFEGCNSEMLHNYETISTLPECRHAGYLIDALQKVSNDIVLYASHEDDWGFSAWMRNTEYAQFDRLTTNDITRRSRKGVVVITDDYDTFGTIIGDGGESFMMPRVWNIACHYTDNVHEYIDNMCKTIKEI